MTNSLSPLQAKAFLTSALTPEASAFPDFDGSTSYDHACKWVREQTQTNGPDHIFGLILEVARESYANDVNWWLRLFGMLNEVRPEGLRAKQELVNLFLSSPPHDLTACAYLLRFLAYVGCSIPWDSLPPGRRTDDLSQIAPLVIADAFVWAKRGTQAKLIVAASLRRGVISRADLAAMIRRWHRLAPEDAWPDLLRDEHGTDAGSVSPILTFRPFGNKYSDRWGTIDRPRSQDRAA